MKINIKLILTVISNIFFVTFPTKAVITDIICKNGIYKPFSEDVYSYDSETSTLTLNLDFDKVSSEFWVSTSNQGVINVFVSGANTETTLTIIGAGPYLNDLKRLRLFCCF